MQTIVLYGFAENKKMRRLRKTGKTIDSTYTRCVHNKQHRTKKTETICPICGAKTQQIPCKNVEYYDPVTFWLETPLLHIINGTCWFGVKMKVLGPNRAEELTSHLPENIEDLKALAGIYKAKLNMQIITSPE